MKLGILTFQFYDNYGSVLQAFALQESIKESVAARHLPYDVTIVPVFPDVSHGIKKYLGRTPFSTYCKLLRVLGRARTIFNKFRQRYFDYGEVAPFAYSEWRRLKENYDALVVGSDNVWSPLCVPLDGPMGRVFYDGGDVTMKISYAASCGAYLDSNVAHDLAARIRAASYVRIGCREQSLVEYLSALSPTLNCDPTLLHPAGWWIDKLSLARRNQRPYCLVYDLGHPCQVQLKDVAGRQGAKEIVAVNASPFSVAFKFFTIPVQKWLEMFWCAETVVTNSFHGVVFSIIFHKPFFYVPIIGEKSALNARVIGLLQALDLRERMLTKPSGHDETMRPIDWKAAEARLAVMRSEANDFIVKAGL